LLGKDLRDPAAAGAGAYYECVIEFGLGHCSEYVQGCSASSTFKSKPVAFRALSQKTAARDY
jgi:hypothetical protein